MQHLAVVTWFGNIGSASYGVVEIVVEIENGSSLVDTAFGCIVVVLGVGHISGIGCSSLRGA